MAVTIPGTSIVVDHFRDHTWREEFFTESGTDYEIVIWREREGWGTEAEDDINNRVWYTKKDIPAGPDPDDPGTILPGKPKAVKIRISDILTPTGMSRLSNAMTADFQLLKTGVPYDPNTSALFSIPFQIIACNELVCADHNQRRILDYNLKHGLITQADYNAQEALLLKTFE